MPLTQAPELGSVDVDGDFVADGTGFALYIAGEPYIFQTDAIPTGTTWTLRTHEGAVVRASADGPYEHIESSDADDPGVMRARPCPACASPSSWTRRRRTSKSWST